jgi:hypothetical protein
MSVPRFRFTPLLLVTVLAKLTVATAQEPFALLHSLFNPSTNAQAGAEQGYSAAVDGNLAVVGSPSADVGAFNSGVVKVYDATTGGLLHTLTNPSPEQDDDLFGNSVAISGSRVVVGAHRDSSGDLYAGSAYVYDLASATPTIPVLTLTNPSPEVSGEFGFLVAVSGTHLVVAADGNNTVYVYDLVSAIPAMPMLTLTNPSPDLGDGFGNAVAISDTRVVIGAIANDTSRVYVYDLSGTTPGVPVATLNDPSSSSSASFGKAVAISGMRVVVGPYWREPEVGGAYAVYDLASASPTEPVTVLNNPNPSSFNDGFGNSVSISGMRVVVGAAWDDAGAPYSGSAYVYDLTTATPTVHTIALVNPTPALGDYFGYSVAISGTRILIGVHGDDTGATDAGSAYVYDLASATPTEPSATLNHPILAAMDHFGTSVAISGSRLVVGAPNAGHAYVYDLASVTPKVPVATLNAPNASLSGGFGYAVAVSDARVAIGMPGIGDGSAGSAFVYDLAGATPAVPVFTLTNPTPAFNDNFASSLAIVGTTVVIGTPADDTGAFDAGSTYVYDLASANPTVPVLTLTNPSPAARDSFGHSVAIAGSRVIVGAPNDDLWEYATGSAYVYDRSSATPAVPIARLPNPNPASGGNFGYSLGISETRLLITAPGNSAGRGSAFVYELMSARPFAPVLALTNPTSTMLGTGGFGYAAALSGALVAVGTSGGAAFVYDLTNATPTVPILLLTNPTPATAGQFGVSVAIGGTTVIAGDPRDDSEAVDRGAAYVFRVGSAPPPRLNPHVQGPFALLHSLFDPGTDAQAGAQQGYSVAVDGDLTVVGVPGAGVVKVYNATTSTLLYTLPRPTLFGGFGISVAISGTRVVVGTGTGTVYVYDLASPTPVVPLFTLNRPGWYESFGQSVGISGNWVIVGAPLETVGAFRAGTAYVYDLASDTPLAPTMMLTNPTPANGFFGYFVAASENRAVVESGNTGNVYVYDLSSSTPGRPTLRLDGPATSVAISGTRIVVGAAHVVDSAKVYDLASATPAVPVATLMDPTPDVPHDNFGVSVAIYGTRVVVGAPNDGSGALSLEFTHVYDLQSATPTIPITTLTNPSPATPDWFGHSVAISGSKVVVGAPFDDTVAYEAGSAYVYDIAGIDPTIPSTALNHPSPSTQNRFGGSVSISGKIVVVQPGYFVQWPWTDAGDVHVYDLASATPMVPVVTLSDPTAGDGGIFGAAADVSGTRVVVGHADRKVYVYDLANGTPSVPVAGLTKPGPPQDDNFGFSVAISGNWVVVGASTDDSGSGRNGSAFVYDLASATPTVPLLTLTNPGPTVVESFGRSLDIDETRVAVGAPFDSTLVEHYVGSAYIYDLAGLTPTVPVFTLTNPSPAFNDNFASSLAISGTRVVIGTLHNMGDDAGSVYVYDVASATPTVPVLTLINPSPAFRDYFGFAVAISGSHVVVGAYGGPTPDTPSNDGGSVYVYDLSSATPALPVATLTKRKPVESDYFGYSVAVDGATIVVGSPLDDTIAADRGAVYVFGLAPELSVVPAAPGLATISWAPTTSSGFVLQYTDTLNHANWINTPSGAGNPVTIPVTNTSRFYRLLQR